MLRLIKFWEWRLKYYKSMKEAFPEEPIWDRCIKDTESLLEGDVW